MSKCLEKDCGEKVLACIGKGHDIFRGLHDLFIRNLTEKTDRSCPRSFRASGANYSPLKYISKVIKHMHLQKNLRGKFNQHCKP